MTQIKGKFLISKNGHKYQEISLLNLPIWIKKIIWENTSPDEVIGKVMYFKGKKYRYCVYFKKDFQIIVETGWLEGEPLLQGLRCFKRKRKNS